MARLLTIEGGHSESADRVNGVSLKIGDYVAVLGRCGTGKSSFCVGLQGFIEGVRIETAHTLVFAYIPSNPALVFTGIKGTVQGEIELTFQFQGKKIGDVEELARIFGCEDLLGRDPFTLSGGESLKVAVCILAALDPDVWILDQAYEWLSPDIRQEYRAKLLKRYGDRSAILETHAIAPTWRAEFNRWLILGRGKAVESVRDCSVVDDPFLLSPHYERIGRPERVRGASGIVGAALKVEGLSYRYHSGAFQLGPIDIEFDSGQIVAIIGPNGSGKTTFMRCLALLLPPCEGVVSVCGGVAHSTPHQRPRQILYSFQNPDDQLYKGSVLAEIEDVCSSLGLERRGYWKSLLSNFDLDACLNVDPLGLSRPQRRLVTLASTLIAAPPVILLDEPTAGLDGYQRHQVATEVVRYAEGGGLAIVVSHDTEFTTTIANATVQFEAGRIRDICVWNGSESVRGYLSNEDFRGGLDPRPNRGAASDTPGAV